MLARVATLFRDTRIAVLLIAGLAGYSVALSSLPDRASWYSNPIFLLCVAWLTVSTAVCASDRTRWAWRAATRPEARRRALASRAIRNGEQVVSPEGLELLAEGLRGLGLKVHVEDDGLFAHSRTWAHLGSPLFHWALVVMLAAAALGQLTRAEGSLYIPVGSSVPDQRASYVRGISEGPLFRDRFTGLDIAVKDVAPDYSVGGVSRGATPLVVVSRGGEVVASTHVYPNSPARAGALLVHRGEVGPALIARFAFPGGTSQDVTISFPLDPGTRRPQPVALDLSTGGSTFSVSAAPAAGGRVTFLTKGAGSTGLAPGESAQLPGGISVAIVGRTTYVRLVVVNDWTVPVLYAAFVVAVVGSTIALLLPPRAVFASLGSDGTLSSAIAASAIDPLFRSRAMTVLSVASTSPEE